MVTLLAICREDHWQDCPHVRLGAFHGHVLGSGLKENLPQKASRRESFPSDLEQP